MDTINSDIRELRKWLNEEPNRPLDRQALARVLHHVECTLAAPGPWEVRSHLDRRSLAKHWTVSRRVGRDYEWLTNAAGRRKRFRSEEAAEAARAALAV